MKFVSKGCAVTRPLASRAYELFFTIGRKGSTVSRKSKASLAVLKLRKQKAPALVKIYVTYDHTARYHWVCKHAIAPYPFCKLFSPYPFWPMLTQVANAVTYEMVNIELTPLRAFNPESPVSRAALRSCCAVSEPTWVDKTYWNSQSVSQLTLYIRVIFKYVQ